MDDYKPDSRRPIADVFRRTAHFAVYWCLRHNVHPDLVSYSSIVASVLAALCFWQSHNAPALLIVAPLFCYLRLWFNMLDGMVALASAKASPHGEIVNELPDRISDVLIFVSLGFSGFCSIHLAYWTAIAAVLVAYVGTLGQAVGAQREFSGPMSKQWRMVALHIGSWAAFALYMRSSSLVIVWGLTALDLTCWLIIIGSVLTVFIRLRRIGRTLRDNAAANMTTASNTP